MRVIWAMPPPVVDAAPPRPPPFRDAVDFDAEAGSVVIAPSAVL